MKKIEITLKRDDNLREMEQLAGYLGGRTPLTGKEEPDAKCRRVTLSEPDRPLLERYWDESAGSLAERLKSHIAAFEYFEDGIRLTLKTGDSFEAARRRTVESLLKSHLTAALATRWLRITLPDEARGFSVEAERMLTEAERMLCHREAPRRGVRP